MTRTPPPIRTPIEELEARGVRFRHYGIFDRNSSIIIECHIMHSPATPPGMPHPQGWFVRGLPACHPTLEDAAEALCCHLSAADRLPTLRQQVLAALATAPQAQVERVAAVLGIGGSR